MARQFLTDDSGNPGENPVGATALALEQVADGEKLAAEIQNGWVPILARKMLAST